MLIIGCDFHTRYQQIAMAREETAEMIQKTDERDARLILDLLLSKRFPKIWVPTPAERDLRQLLWHRHKLVRLRTMLGNQAHFLAMSQGLCRKKKLFTKKGRVELG